METKKMNDLNFSVVCPFCGRTHNESVDYNEFSDNLRIKKILICWERCRKEYVAHFVVSLSTTCFKIETPEEKNRIVARNYHLDPAPTPTKKITKRTRKDKK